MNRKWLGEQSSLHESINTLPLSLPKLHNVRDSTFSGLFMGQLTKLAQRIQHLLTIAGSLEAPGPLQIAVGNCGTKNACLLIFFIYF